MFMRHGGSKFFFSQHIYLTFTARSIDSSNIYKLYQAVGRQIAAHPEDHKKFPNYTPNTPPILVLGPQGPLQGGRHFAQYFHGK